ncbi:hypothetical protein SSCG_03334 [Streptomyces clavuligerus]|nr:hypothetical protein SSCG_03334 [Streptomyces clavuligerus]
MEIRECFRRWGPVRERLSSVRARNGAGIRGAAGAAPGWGPVERVQTIDGELLPVFVGR